MNDIEPIDAVRGRVKAFDRVVDTWFDHLRGRVVPDRLFYLASELGDWSLLWHLIGWTRALDGRPESVRRAAELTVALGAESAFVNGLVKSLFRRERPVWDQHRPHSLRRPRSSSFPSGHASSAFLAASMLSRNRGWAGPVHVLAVVVALSRVHVKIHHASDVVAGAALGVALGRLARRAGR